MAPWCTPSHSDCRCILPVHGPVNDTPAYATASLPSECACHMSEAVMKLYAVLAPVSSTAKHDHA